MLYLTHEDIKTSLIRNNAEYIFSLKNKNEPSLVKIIFDNDQTENTESQDTKLFGAMLYLDNYFSKFLLKNVVNSEEEIIKNLWIVGYKAQSGDEWKNLECSYFLGTFKTRSSQEVAQNFVKLQKKITTAKKKKLSIYIAKTLNYVLVKKGYKDNLEDL